jgi:hypothetical protein
MISGKKRAISWNENMHDVRTLLYSLPAIPDVKHSLADISHQHPTYQLAYVT